MYIECIKLLCKMHIVFTAASYRTNFLHTVIIFKNAHKAGDRTFHRCFIDNIGTFNAGLRNSTINIIKHDSIRSGASDLFVHNLSGQVASYLSFRKNFSLIKSSGLCCLRLRLCFRFNNLCLCLCFAFLCFLSASAKQSGCRQYCC